MPSPAAASLEITSAKDENVFDTGDALSFQLHALPAGLGALSINYTITDYLGRVVDRGTQQQTEKLTETPLLLDRSHYQPGEVYRLDVNINAGGKIRDEVSTLFGIKGSLDQPPTSQPAGLADIPGPLHMATTEFWPSRFGQPSALDDFKKLVDLAKSKGFACVSIGVWWTGLEPLRGVYRFPELDAMVAYVKQAGMKVAIEVTGFHRAPEWILPMPHLSDDEGVVHDLWSRDQCYLIPSPANPGFLNALGQLWQAIAGHYAGDPDVVGFTFSGLFHDSFYLRYPGPGRTSLPAFRDYLKSATSDSLQKLNQRWGGHYDSWEEVEFPGPLQNVNQADLSAPRKDAEAFAQKVFADYVKTVVEAIRSKNSYGWIQLYWLVGAAPNYSVFDYLVSRGGFMADGGNEAEQSISRVGIATYLRGASQLTESGLQVPKNRYNIDMLFTRLFYGGNGAYFRVLWNKNIAPTSLPPALDCLDYLSSSWKGVLEELRNARTPRLEVAALDTQGRISNFLSGFDASQKGAEISFPNALFSSHVMPFWLDDYSSTKQLASARLLFVGADNMLMSDERIKGIGEWVRNGGHLVVYPSSGRWRLDESSDQADFALLREFGIILTKTGRRCRDMQATISHGDVFKTARKLPLYPRALDGSKAGIEIYSPSGQFETLASFSSGDPAIVRYTVGKGEVLLILQSVDWARDIANPANAEDGIIDDLCRWAGVSRLFSSEQPDFRMSVLQKDDTRWLLLHRFTKDRLANVQGTRVTAKPTSDNLAQPRLSGNVRLFFLDDGRQYLVSEITGTEHARIQLSGKELRENGLPVNEMIAKETRVYRIEPLK